MTTDLSSLNRIKLAECLPKNLQLKPKNETLDAIHNSMLFLGGMDPLELDGEELEVTIMHTAFLIDQSNEFQNNMNIDPARRGKFIEHCYLMKNSDIDVWIRKLYDSNFWKSSNSTIANVLYNWLKGTLVTPEGFI